jgi:hypothetical protein
VGPRYGVAHRARAHRLDLVCHPERTNRRPCERIETHARDSERLARSRWLASWRCCAVPTPAEEEPRDLVTAPRRGELEPLEQFAAPAGEPRISGTLAGGEQLCDRRELCLR